MRAVSSVELFSACCNIEDGPFVHLGECPKLRRNPIFGPEDSGLDGRKAAVECTSNLGVTHTLVVAELCNDPAVDSTVYSLGVLLHCVELVREEKE
jgi:hypothetical protein